MSVGREMFSPVGKPGSPLKGWLGKGAVTGNAFS